MRIISGKFKGKKISFISSSKTRPLRDYVRENIFNIITHGKKVKINMEKANILDLYSGVGSFGIECLSRYLCNVVFVEKDPLASTNLKKNIINLKLSHRVKIISEDTINYLKKFNYEDKFDLIFLDPPYKDISFLSVIALIKEKKIFNKNHKVIIHRERGCEEVFNDYFKVDLEKNYGRSKIIFGSF